MFKNLKAKFLHFYEQYETRFEIGFFVGGFCFDILMMSDVDDVLVIVQQAVYLLIIASIIHYETLFASLKWAPKPDGKIAKMWEFRSLIFSSQDLASPYLRAPLAVISDSERFDELKSAFSVSRSTGCRS